MEQTKPLIEKKNSSGAHVLLTVSQRIAPAPGINEARKVPARQGWKHPGRRRHFVVPDNEFSLIIGFQSVIAVADLGKPFGRCNGDVLESKRPQTRQNAARKQFLQIGNQGQPMIHLFLLFQIVGQLGQPFFQLIDTGF